MPKVSSSLRKCSSCLCHLPNTSFYWFSRTNQPRRQCKDCTKDSSKSHYHAKIQEKKRKEKKQTKLKKIDFNIFNPFSE